MNVYINHEKKFAFVEMRSVEEASNAMALDGIIFEVRNLPIKRTSSKHETYLCTAHPKFIRWCWPKSFNFREPPLR